MVILRTRNKITDFFMILAWASPFKTCLKKSSRRSIADWYLNDSMVLPDTQVAPALFQLLTWNNFSDDPLD